MILEHPKNALPFGSWLNGIGGFENCAIPFGSRILPRLLASLLAVLGGLACVGLAGCKATASPNPSPTASPTPLPGRIGYDNQCFIINGNDTFIYSGAFHYFRCPKALWADRFQKMKDAGLNCVETYVAWNWHERRRPESLDDFSKIDMSDLTDWLDMAINRFGFYVILRPGPYICAEWDGGGYPQWLATERPAGARQTGSAATIRLTSTGANTGIRRRRKRPLPSRSRAGPPAGAA